MRLILINGANINMLGSRNRELYGSSSYKNLVSDLLKHAKTNGVCLKVVQSNYEGKIITFIQKNFNKFDGWIVNLGAFTHYSYGIRDALELVKQPIVEVHITDINNREPFRKTSVIEDLASVRIIGHGTNGYKEAIDFFAKGGK